MIHSLSVPQTSGHQATNGPVTVLVELLPKPTGVHCVSAACISAGSRCSMLRQKQKREHQENKGKPQQCCFDSSLCCTVKAGLGMTPLFVLAADHESHWYGVVMVTWAVLPPTPQLGWHNTTGDTSLQPELKHHRLAQFGDGQ